MLKTLFREFSIQKPGLLGDMADAGAGTGCIQKVNLGHLIEPKSEVLKNKSK